MVTPSGGYKTIGVHVGNIDNKNYSVVFVYNIYLDFIMPTLVDFQEQFGLKEDGVKYSKILNRIMKENETAFFLRELERGENELKRN